MHCLHKPLLCSSVTFHFQQERIVLSSLFMISCSCWTDFFFFKELWLRWHIVTQPTEPDDQKETKTI